MDGQSYRFPATWLGFGLPRYRFPDPINSPSMEYAQGVDGEGFLYFASERPGMVVDVEAGSRPPADIYKSNLKIDSLCPGM